jgi:hypothetical protein
LQHLRQCVDLLGVKLAHAVGLYQLDDVLGGCRLVKPMPKGFTDQCAGRRMILTLASMDLCEQLASFLPANTPHYDATGATPVEIPLHQRVSLSQMGNWASGCTVIGKDIIFQVGLNLGDPCIRTNLSFWILRVGVHGVPRDAYDPWRAPWNQGHQDRQPQGAGLAPFTQFSWSGCQLMYSSFKDTIWD